LIGEEKEEEKDEEADGAVVWLREGVRGPWEPLFPIFDLSFELFYHHTIRPKITRIYRKKFVWESFLE